MAKDEEKKQFYIPKIEEETTSGGSGVPLDHFASSVSGYNNKDSMTYPHMKNTKESRYDAFRNKEDRQGSEANYISPEKKYDPSRIPSYLRREEPAISRSNIDYLKDEKPDDRTLYNRNREQYRKYSEQNSFGDDRGVVRSVMKEETGVRNETPYVKPTRNERSTLVITRRNEENNDSYQTYAPRKEEVESIYDAERKEPQNVQNYQTETPYNRPEYARSTETERPVERTEAVFNSQRVDRNDYQEPRESEHPKFFTVEEEQDNYYDDISIDTGNEKEIEELDAYQAEPQVKFENKPVEAKVKRVIKRTKYVKPPLSILKKSGTATYFGDDSTEFQKTAINSTLDEFNIGGHVVSQVKGPTVTQFEVKLDPGVKVNKIEGITRNLQMNLASNYIRMEAPIPGKSTVGIEVPNQKKSIVTLGDLLDDDKYLNDGKPINVVLGRGVSGEARYADIREMPHALIAGSTGSGKTVCIYSIITSILYKATPDEVKLILIDPKRNELMFFENVPHLASPIIDESKLATAAIKWAVDEMERRYELFRPARSRTVEDYNRYVSENGNGEAKLPYIVIVIDEFADLMTTAGSSFEVNVQRICQKARSAGIHLIVATQRPSVDIIKGAIKANIQTRIAFSVNSQTDSLTILDHVGAEKLLGKGDMLYSNGGSDIRIQGAYVGVDEINQIVDSISTENIDYMFTLEDLASEEEEENVFGETSGYQSDDKLVEIARFVVKNQRASMNQICRMFNIGYNRIDSIMDELQDLGIVSPVIQGKPRGVLVSSEDELDQILKNR